MKNPKFNFNDKGIAEAHSLLANSFNANTPHDLCESWILATFARRGSTGKACYDQYKAIGELEKTLKVLKDEIKAHAINKGYGKLTCYTRSEYVVPEKEMERFSFLEEHKS